MQVEKVERKWRRGEEGEEKVEKMVKVEGKVYRFIAISSVNQSC